MRLHPENVSGFCNFYAPAFLIPLRRNDPFSPGSWQTLPRRARGSACWVYRQFPFLGDFATTEANCQRKLSTHSGRLTRGTDSCIVPPTISSSYWYMSARSGSGKIAPPARVETRRIMKYFGHRPTLRSFPPPLSPADRRFSGGTR